MSRIIDADTHIAESPGMWSLIHPCKDLFRDYRIYVACEADEDIPFSPNSSVRIT